MQCLYPLASSLAEEGHARREWAVQEKIVGGGSEEH